MATNCETSGEVKRGSDKGCYGVPDGANNKYERISEKIVGKNVFFRTVTYHMVGKVVAVLGNFVELADGACVFDSGRFMNFLKEGIPTEVEPTGGCFVNLEAVTDFFPWPHPLLKEQK